MSDDLWLFGDDDLAPAPAPAAPTASTSAAKWQVDMLRKALDGRGLTLMTERQAAIEAAVGRKVESLQQLTSDEALRALNTLGSDHARSSSPRSAWDDRGEDTWIDRL